MHALAQPLLNQIKNICEIYIQHIEKKLRPPSLLSGCCSVPIDEKTKTVYKEQLVRLQTFRDELKLNPDTHEKIPLLTELTPFVMALLKNDPAEKYHQYIKNKLFVTEKELEASFKTDIFSAKLYTEFRMPFLEIKAALENAQGYSNTVRLRT